MKYLKILILILLFNNSSCQSPSQTDLFLEGSSLFEAGFDIDNWNETDSNIIIGNYGLMNSVLVIHNDKLILEKYYNDWSAEKLHHIKSSTKSIASLLIGIAIENNYIKSLDQKMVDFFPEFNYDTLDTLRSTITMENLLTMTAGFEWDEWSKKFNESGNSLGDMAYLRDDWENHVFNLPIVDTPGTKFTYNTGTSFMLGAILEREIDQKIETFAENYLFNPLNIKGINGMTTSD